MVFRFCVFFVGNREVYVVLVLFELIDWIRQWFVVLSVIFFG